MKKEEKRVLGISYDSISKVAPHCNVTDLYYAYNEDDLLYLLAFKWRRRKLMLLRSCPTRLALDALLMFDALLQTRGITDIPKNYLESFGVLRRERQQ